MSHDLNNAACPCNPQCQNANGKIGKCEYCTCPPADSEADQIRNRLNSDIDYLCLKDARKLLHIVDQQAEELAGRDEEIQSLQRFAQKVHDQLAERDADLAEARVEAERLRTELETLRSVIITWHLSNSQIADIENIKVE